MKIRTLLLFLSIACFFSCEDSKCVKGDGNITTQTFNLSAIQSFTTVGSWDVELVYGTTQSVSATGDANIVSRLNMDESNGHLDISLDDGCHSNFELTVRIESPLVNSVRTEGSGDVRITGNNTTLPNLNITSEGSGSVIVNSDMDISDLDANSTGSGDLELFRINSNDADVSTDGSGDIEVTVQNSLTCSLTGSGSVYYKGSASVSQTDSGSGDVINAN